MKRGNLTNIVVKQLEMCDSKTLFLRSLGVDEDLFFLEKPAVNIQI